MTDLSDLVQERCDFCECGWDDELDDPLVPLHIGDPPQPRRIRSQGISDSRLGGRKEQHFRALQNALNDMDEVDYEVHDRVRQVKSIGGDEHFSKMADGGEHPYFESEVNDQKTAAEIVVYPEAREVEPDAMVCQDCAEMFRNLSEE